MDKILISIIIPVYNVEKYLPECMQSLLEDNNLSRTEILLIDDGSTDSSGDICDKYSNDIVKVYHKKNGGLSDARNYGLLRASGKYVFFLDSDDKVVPRAVEKILNLVQNEDVDIVLWDALIIEESGEVSKKQESGYYLHSGLKESKHYTGLEIIEEQIDNYGDYVTTVWLGLYRRELLLSEHIWFEKDLLHEDEMWTQKVLICAKDVVYLNRKLYLYRNRANSIMNQSERDYTKNIQSLIYIYSSLPAYVDWKVSDKQSIKKIKSNIAKRYLYMIYRYDVQKYPKLLKKIKRLEIFENAGTKKDRLRSLMLLLNINLYCWIMKKVKAEDYEKMD